MPLPIILGGLGLLCSFLFATLLGRMIRAADLRSEWLTDDEADLARMALSCHPVVRIELAGRHHIFLDMDAHTVERVWRGRRFAVNWDARLDGVSEASSTPPGSPEVESR